MNEDIERIIEVANELLRDGTSAGSTSEQIAAAFILNDMDKLPGCYLDIVEAWDRLGSEWQGYVIQLKQDYRHLFRHCR